MGPSPGSPPRSVSAQLNPSLFRREALDEDDDDDTTALHSDSVASFSILTRRRVIQFFYPNPTPTALDAVGTNLLYLFITRGI